MFWRTTEVYRHSIASVIVVGAWIAVARIMMCMLLCLLRAHSDRTDTGK